MLTWDIVLTPSISTDFGKINKCHNWYNAHNGYNGITRICRRTPIFYPAPHSITQELRRIDKIIAIIVKPCKIIAYNRSSLGTFDSNNSFPDVP